MSGNGVSDLVPLSLDRVLLLERGFVKGEGNAVRVYEVDLRGAKNVSALPDAREANPMAKRRLVFDLAEIPDKRCKKPRQRQPRDSLANYEGMALGPTHTDGRRILFLLSDDNFSDEQTARILALALAPGTL
jgi:Esterase-like activity of phytase